MSVSRTPPAHVAVIGGGLIGLSCAFELARRGARVSLFEAGRFGGGASGAAGGMLCPGAEARHEGFSQQYAQFCRQSLDLWPSFAADIAQASGRSLAPQICGSIIPCEDAQAAQALAADPLFASLDARALDHAGMAARQTGLDRSIRAGVFVAAEAHIDPREAVAALVAALRALGADLREGARVEGLDVRNGAARGLSVASGQGDEEIVCDAVIVASGLDQGLTGHAPALSSLYPVQGQMAALDGTGLGLKRILRGAAYLIPRSGDEIWLGASAEPGRADCGVEEAVIADLLDKAIRLFPALKGRRILRRWAGVRPGAQGGLPMIGAHGPDGVFLAAGHYRNGVLTAPATARAMGALVLGETPPLDVAAFAPDQTLAAAGA